MVSQVRDVALGPLISPIISFIYLKMLTNFELDWIRPRDRRVLSAGHVTDNNQSENALDGNLK